MWEYDYMREVEKTITWENGKMEKAKWLFKRGTWKTWKIRTCLFGRAKINWIREIKNMPKPNITEKDVRNQGISLICVQDILHI